MRNTVFLLICLLISPQLKSQVVFYEIENIFFKTYKHTKDTLGMPFLLEKDTFGINDTIYFELSLGLKQTYHKGEYYLLIYPKRQQTINSINLFSIDTLNRRSYINKDLINIENSFYKKEMFYTQTYEPFEIAYISELSYHWRAKSIEDFIYLHNNDKYESGATWAIRIVMVLPRKYKKKGLNRFEVSILFEDDKYLKKKYRVEYGQNYRAYIFKEKPDYNNSMYFSYTDSIYIE